jgi:hypothetical protein
MSTIYTYDFDFWFDFWFLYDFVRFIFTFLKKV